MTARLSALVVVLLLVGSTLRADFAVTEERPLAPTLGISTTARVVATDDGFLAFWKTRTTYGLAGLMQVAKLSPDGALLRRAVAWDLPASFHAYDGASNGEETLLAGFCSGTYGAPLCLARFSADGDFLGLTTTQYSNVVAPSIASDGNGFLVSFSISSGATREVVALPVSRDGVPGAPIVVDSWDPLAQWSSPAAIGGTYFVAFPRPGAHALARLSRDAVESTVSLDPPVEIAQVRIENSGERLLVVVTPRGPAPSDVWLQAAVFDRELARLTEWFPLTGHAGLPRIAPTSSGWIVSGGGAGQATVVAVSRAGSVGVTAYVEGPEVFDLDLAAARDRAALVWTTGIDYTFPGAAFNAARVAVLDAAAAFVRTPTTISLGPAPQIDPAGAHGGGGVTLAAWVERTIEERFVVKVRPFDRDGVPLAPPATMPWRGFPQTSPSVASDGTSFFVVWSEGARGLDGVWGARVTTDGRVVDAAAIPLFGPALHSWGEPRTAAVDWSGDSWIVVSSAGKADIVARRVSSAGTLVGDPAVIAAGTEDASFGALGGYGPVIDCNGTTCLVAWNGPLDPWSCRISPCQPPPPSILAARVSPSLTLLDRAPLRLNGPYEWVSTLSVSWNEPASAWSVAWSFEGRRRVARDGTLDALLEPKSAQSGSVSAIPEGAGWHLAWASGAGGVFHGWSATGGVREVERRYIMRSVERESNPQLVAAPRPLAFVVRESQLTAGSPAVIGRFLDESTEPLSESIELTVTRLPHRNVYFSWRTEIDIVSGFVLWGLFDGKWYVIYTLSPDQRVHQRLEEGATAYRITANTPAGVFESNVVTMPPMRRRVAGR